MKVLILITLLNYMDYGVYSFELTQSNLAKPLLKEFDGNLQIFQVICILEQIFIS